ncbi:hypothetical protein KC343_g1631 [Hortaea werneckii]|nr:hypothetical protein KC338_g7918 [Hortaea werneckii]KAI6859680.1 hypothetical protein KC323_g6490 [Hortaea werneckii]KAI7255349.1 hypothetical protein KC352_g11577 [Hortaea werneckii]KAI7570505.1 hypothetical protein KC317_g2404 [Hortaea werneckii]KAI7599108.1 hypothetical protein KC346_g13912 [Hortaea werneckii]
MQQLTLLGMAASAAAQIPVSNPNVTVRTCSDLDTCDITGTQGICQLNSSGDYWGATNGIGIVPSAVDFGGNTSAAGDNTNLSLTLIDNVVEGHYVVRNYNNPKTLYVGSPPSVNLTEGPPGCALLMQYAGQTFPPLDLGGSTILWTENHTSCPIDLSPDCFGALLESSLRTFNYTGEDSEHLPRCEALAQYVETSMRRGDGGDQFRPFCAYSRPLISVFGGAISGPDVSTEAASILNTTEGDDGCRPVQPQNHTLHEVLTANQMLFSNWSTADLNMLGGRTGYTPIITVLFGDRDSDPDAQAFCMKLRSPEGNVLPFQTRNGTSPFELRGGAAGLKGREAMWYAAAAALLVVALS